jgi:hypothetical protein
MPLPREVDFLPGGDYAFVVVKPTVRGKAELWFYDWEQVENNREDGRFIQNPPKTRAAVGNRELLLLAKYLLQAAGHIAAKHVVVPDQQWNTRYSEEDNEEKT